VFDGNSPSICNTGESKSLSDQCGLQSVAKPTWRRQFFFPLNKALRPVGQGRWARFLENGGCTVRKGSSSVQGVCDIDGNGFIDGTVLSMNDGGRMT
jgi:hypothetical protein